MVINRIAQTHANTPQSSETKEIRFGNGVKLKYHFINIIMSSNISHSFENTLPVLLSLSDVHIVYSTCRIRTHVTSLICPNSMDLIQLFVFHAIQKTKTFTINDGISKNVIESTIICKNKNHGITAISQH